MAALVAATTPSLAQSTSNQSGLGGIANLIGSLAQAGARSKAQKAWMQASEPIRACVNTALAPKNVTIDQLIAAGIAPADARAAPLVTFCNQVMAAQLKTNIACNVTNSKGQQVASTCNQVFAKDENGSVSEITRDEFIQRAASSQKVQIAILETSVANAARLQTEQRQAEAERQRFLASPEGKRQLAAEAERLRKAEAQEKAKIAAEQRARSAALAEKAKIWAQYDCAGSYTRTVFSHGAWIDINESDIKTSMRFAYHRSGPEVQIGGWTRYKQGISISPDNSVYGKNSVIRNGGVVVASFNHVNGDLSYNSVLNTANGSIRVQEIANGNKSVFTGKCSPNNWMR